MEDDGADPTIHLHDCWDAFDQSLEHYGRLQDFVMHFELSFEKRDTILFPGCENCLLSVYMSQKGFKNITTIDSSESMLNYASRRFLELDDPLRWQCMDKSRMKFYAGSFDVVVDKGGLDIMLGEPNEDHTAGIAFLSEVKRVLAQSGKFYVVTLAEHHVMELLLETFRVGWGVAVDMYPSPLQSDLETYTVVANRLLQDSLPLVSLNLTWHGPCNNLHAYNVVKAVDKENFLRSHNFSGTLIGEGHEITLERPSKNLHPGLHLPVEMGDKCHYAAIMDLKKDLHPEHQCSVVWIPRSKSKPRDWQFSTVEGQWHVAEDIKSSRLILIHLHPQYNLNHVREFLESLLRDFLPLGCTDLRVYSLDDTLIETINRVKVRSSLTEKILVEDVKLMEVDAEREVKWYRRMFFKRNPSIVQSEALLIEGINTASPDDEAGSFNAESKETADERRTSKKSWPGQGKREQLDGELQIDYSYVKRPYHQCMVAALVLVAENLERWMNSSQKVRCLMVGLGGGLLPMFLRHHIPFDHVTIVELDRKVGDLAKEYFGFTEDEQMELVIEDGAKYVERIALSVPLSSPGRDSRRPSNDLENTIATLDVFPQESTAELSGASTSGSDLKCIENPESRSFESDSRVHVLIVDADSEDRSSRMTCPSKKFIEDDFLLAARNALVEGGVLMVHIVSTSLADYVTAIAQLRKHYSEVFEFDNTLKPEPSRILIARPQAERKLKSLHEEALRLRRLAETSGEWQNGPDIELLTSELRRLQ